MKPMREYINNEVFDLDAYREDLMVEYARRRKIDEINNYKELLANDNDTYYCNYRSVFEW